jgi:hypothetical protein
MRRLEDGLMATDQEAVEMAAYPMHEYMRWEREHHADGHKVPVEACPICRWGCQVAGCKCGSLLR